MGALNMIERVLLWWVCLVTAAPRRALGGVLLLAVLGAGLAATNLKINTDARDMIAEDVPYRQAQIAFREAFPELDGLILVLVRARSTDEADAFTAELTRALEAREDVVRNAFAPSSHPFFARSGLLLLPEDELEDQLNRLTKAAPVIEALNGNQSLDTLFAAIADRAALARTSDSDGLAAGFLAPVYAEVAHVLKARLAGKPVPLSWHRLFTEETADTGQEQRVIAVSPVLDFESLQPAKATIAVIREEVAAMTAKPIWAAVDVGITGNPALRTEELRSVAEGIEISLIISLISVAFLLWIALRSGAMAVTALSTLVLTLLITAGFAAVTVGALNLVSIAFAVLLIGLGIDFAIHLALHVLETRRFGHTAANSIETTVHEVGGALALCAPTTALAFFAFIPTQFVGMAQLGIISGTGVIIAFWVAVTVIPAAVALWPRRHGGRREAGLEPRRAPRMPALSAGRRGKILTVLILAAGVLAIPLLPQVRFDADPMSLRNPESQSVRVFHRLFDDPKTAPYRLDLLAGSEAEAQAAADRLKDLPEVGQALTVTDFVPADQDIKMEIIDFAAGTLSFALSPNIEAAGRETGSTPVDELGEGTARLREELASPGGQTDESELLRTVLEEYEQAVAQDPNLVAASNEDVFRFWPFQIERLRNQLNPVPITYTSLPDVITERYVAGNGIYRVEIAPADHLDLRDEGDRRSFVEAVAQETPDVTGSALVVLRAGDVVAGAMLQASLLAAAVVFLLLLALLREPLTVLLIMLPVVLAAIFTSAAGVLLNQPYNFANVIVVPLLIGLGADSGIHLALRARQMVRHSAVFSTTTPRAVLFSALTTIASFGSLSLSDHRGTASMGSLLTISIGFTLLCTLIVLPVVMDQIDQLKERRRERRQNI